MGPSDRPDLLGRVFISNFDSRPARAFVLAGIGLFGLAGLASLAFLRTIPILPLICMAALVFHFAPALWPHKSAIDMRNEGFRLDGLGLIPWEAIGKVSYNERQINQNAKARVVALLEIELVATFDLAIVRPDVGPPWRRLQARNWRKVGDSHLTILLSGLTDKPRDIRQAFEVFLGSPITGPRGLVV
ncbi:hypothetical protein MCEMIH15_02072 [Caulobacteraceae bacterium]